MRRARKGALVVATLAADGNELVAAPLAQASDPGTGISNDLKQDVDQIADDCGVEFEAP